MFTVKKKITLDGQSIIDGVLAEAYQATIDSVNPNDMTLANWKQDKDAYKANRKECQENYVKFEEIAFALQEELIAEKEAQQGR